MDGRAPGPGPRAPDVVTTHSPAETEDVAARLAAPLTSGAVVLLYGDLGAGKTAFVRGLARGLGIDPDLVSSPTFVILQEYRGRLTLYHADLYRLEPSGVGDIGLDDVAADGVLAVEWAERLPAVAAGAVSVKIEDLGGDDRRIEISATEERS